MERQDLLEKLNECLKTNADKRRNQIEPLQFAIFKSHLSKIIQERNGEVRVLEAVYESNKKDHCWRLDRFGKMFKGRRKKSVYDSKTMDGYVVLSDKNGITKTIYLVCKGVENEGGSQDNVSQEIAMLTESMKKHKDKSTHFVFILDGKHFNGDLIDQYDKSPNYTFSSSLTIERTLRNIINNF